MDIFRETQIPLYAIIWILYDKAMTDYTIRSQKDRQGRLFDVYSTVQ